MIYVHACIHVCMCYRSCPQQVSKSHHKHSVLDVHGGVVKNRQWQSKQARDLRTPESMTKFSMKLMEDLWKKKKIMALLCCVNNWKRHAEKDGMRERRLRNKGCMKAWPVTLLHGQAIMNMFAGGLRLCIEKVMICDFILNIVLWMIVSEFIHTNIRAWGFCSTWFAGWKMRTWLRTKLLKTTLGDIYRGETDLLERPAF